MSIWADIQDRSSGELDRKEDQLEKVVKELKKKIATAARECAEESIRLSHNDWIKEGIKNHIVERLKKEDQDRFWKLADDYDLGGYAERAFWKRVDYIPEIEEDD